MKKILLLLLVTLFVVSACSSEETTNNPNDNQQDQKNEDENNTGGENGDQDDVSPNPSLTKEEAEEILIEYKNTFEVETNNDGEVIQYDTKEELFNHFTSIMSEQLANSFLETYFKEENGKLSIIPKDAPTWLKTHKSFQLDQKSETEILVKQERNNQLIGHIEMIYTLSYENDRWIVEGIEKKDLGEESQQVAEELVRDHLDLHDSPETQVLFDHKDNGLYVVHVFDIIGEGKGSHTATRGWYKVDPESKEIIDMMDQNQDEVVNVDFKSKARAILETVNNENMEKFAQFVHAEKGLLISPYVNIKEDAVIFQKEEIENLLNDETVYTWGIQDGSGKPLESKPAEYFERYKEFTHPDDILLDNIQQRGNTRNNIKEKFPNSHVVELYNSGTEENANMDRTSLYVVFEKGEHDIWKVVAFVSGQWTI